MTGFAIGSGGSMVTVSVRLSEDGSTAWVSVNGGTETPWTGAGSSSSGEWSNGSILLLIDEGNRGSDFQMGDEFAGVIGGLTDTGSLPEGTAWYNGTWSTASVGGSGSANGAMHMEIDFANNGSIGGNITGGYQGDIDGTVNGSMIEGSIVIGQRKASGTLMFMGGIFGENGELAQGVLSGDLTTANGPDTQAGTFALGKTGR